MEILVIGKEINFHECREKFGGGHHYQFTENDDQIEKLLKPETIVFDFQVSSQPSWIYQNFSGIIFLDVSRVSLQQSVDSTKAKTTCFGFIGLPSFLS
jgi:hypothetical protein